MINAKELYYQMLHDERITDIVGSNGIFDAYPETIEDFPCVIYLEENQNDVEFADNQPTTNNLSFQLHIFTKALDGYATTSQIALTVDEVLKEYYFVCRSNRELQDVQDNVRHRVLNYSRALFDEVL